MVTRPAKKSVPIPGSAGTASTSTTVPAGDPSTSSSASTATVSTTATMPTEPPDVTIPTPPAGFKPVTFKNYRGYFPKADQVAAVQGAVIELQTNGDYDAVFGPGVPASNKLASELTIAAQWSAMRQATELFLAYVRSNEAVTWKSAFIDLDKLDAIYQVLANQNATLVEGFPELGKLLDVPKVITKRAVATRARNAKTKTETATTAASTQSTGATAAPAANATATTPAAPTTGGAAH